MSEPSSSMDLLVPPTKKSLSCEDLSQKSYFNSVPQPGEEQTGNDKETAVKIQFCCSEDTSADEDFGTITEDEIESNFHSYRPYIESCIKITDLIVYFKPFTSEQVKKFYKTSKTDHQGALRLAFDTILDMDTFSDKFQQLLQALEDAEYPKVVGLLKGLLIPIHEANREKLKTHAKDIYERLSVSDILPYLLTYRVLNHHDVDEIKSAEKNESRGSAVIQLLSTLPNRSKEWFENFISALVGSQQRDLAMIIDKELTQVLEAAAVFGVNTPIFKSSLASVKGLRKKYTSKSFSEIDFKREDVNQVPSSGYTKRSSSMEYETDAGTKCYSKGSCKRKGLEDKRTDRSTKCVSCRRAFSDLGSKYFCLDCKEHFCDPCKEFHRRLKVTQEHKIVPVSNNTREWKASDKQLCDEDL